MTDEENAVIEVSKAIQETAKASGKAIEVVRSLCSFVAEITSGSITQAIGIVEDKLAYMRWERQVRFIKRAELLLRELGLPTNRRPVPMSIAIPLLESAFIEEDDELQDLWAQLLANAANASYKHEIRRAYISILQDLTSLDAQIMQKFLTVPEKYWMKPIFTYRLPDEFVFEESKGERRFPDHAVLVSLANLARLGLIGGTMLISGEILFNEIRPTLIGYDFILACTVNTKRPNHEL
jgi:hypothetical protein